MRDVTKPWIYWSAFLSETTVIDESMWASCGRYPRYGARSARKTETGGRQRVHIQHSLIMRVVISTAAQISPGAQGMVTVR